MLLLTGCGIEPLTSGETPGTAVQTTTAEKSQTTTEQTKVTAGTTALTSVTENSNRGTDEPDTNSLPETTDDSSAVQFDPATGHLIYGVPHLDQTSGYATACESLAAVSLMQYFGAEIDPGTFIREYLPVADYPYSDSNNDLHAESPWDYFIGDPLKSNGYGCYSPVIAKAIEQSPFEGDAELLRDVPLSTLCSDYIDNDIPVMIWATIEMQPTRAGHTWYLPTGEKFTFLRPEHALLLIGYDSDSYYFSDSLAENEITPYAKSAVETAYKSLYRQAIVLHSNELNAG